MVRSNYNNEIGISIYGSEKPCKVLNNFFLKFWRGNAKKIGDEIFQVKKANKYFNQCFNQTAVSLILCESSYGSKYSSKVLRNFHSYEMSFYEG